MSQSLPPQMEGQVDAPNPLELFWEQHQKKIKGVGFLLLLVIGAYYVLQYMNELERDRANAQFETVTGMANSFTDPAAGLPILQLDRSLAKVDLAELEGYLAGDAKGTKFEPWAAWIAARCYIQKKDWDSAERWLHHLKTNYANHYLCAVSDYPPQVREEKEEGNGKGKGKEKEKEKKDKKPELKPPVKGSLVDRLLADIKTNRAFRKAHPRFEKPLEPQGRIISIKFDDQEVLVQLYEKVLPEQTAALVELIQPKDGKNFFDGQKVYKLTRDSEDAKVQREPRTVHFGLAVTRDEPDASKWAEALTKPAHKVMDFPTSKELENLHFFPGMLGAELAKDGKTTINRLFLTGNDCSASFDGSYVILGKVVGGLDILNGDILNRPMASADEEKLGIGRPGEPINVTVALKK